MKTLLTAAIFRGGDGKVEVCAAREASRVLLSKNLSRPVADLMNVEKNVIIPRRLAREIGKSIENFFSLRFRGFRRFDDS
jgi:hypothetical protein